MKHLKLFFALFAMLALGVGNAWGETVEFTPSNCTDWTADQVEQSQTIDGITLHSTKAANTNNQLRLYAGATHTFSSTVGNITSILFTCTANGTSNYGPGKMTGDGYVAGTGKTGEWTGNSTEVTLTGGQSRCTSIVVTYTPSSGGSETSKQKYTLTYQAGSVTGSLEVEEGANLLDALKDITPVACDPTSTERIGWSENEITPKQANAPTLLTDADVMPSEEHSVYYVFANKETIDGGVVNNNAFSATLGGSNGDNISSGYVLTKAAEAKAGYYQDGSGDVRYVQIKSTSPMFTSTPNSITVTAKIGGGTGNKTLSNPVEAQLVDKDGNLIGSAVTITKKITTNTGDSYEVNVPITGITSAYGLRISHKKESGYNVRYYSMSLSYTTSGTSTIFTDYITSCGSASDVIVKTLRSIAITGMKQEFVEGDEFTFGGTCTATYSVTKNDVAQDDETKTVTPTVSAPNMTQIGEQTVNVSYTDGGVTAETSYIINITEKPKYTITWNNAGDDSNTTTVVQGAALGELLPVADCTSGKEFMGWTAATEVNSDGTGIVYIKETDIPTKDTTYYAVFAVVEGGDATPTTATVSIASCGWTDKTKYTTLSIDENITASVSDGTNTGTFYLNGNNWRLYQTEDPTLTISATASYEIQTVKVTYSVSNTGVLTLDGSNVTSGTACEVNAASVTFGVGNTESATNGQVRITDIEVVYAPAAAKSDYSLDCELHQDPFLTVTETAFDFGTLAKDETTTKTFTVTGGYLAEDVALTISGTNASFFSVSPTTIAKADDVEETVTVTYNPTATGDHTAILTIKTGDITKKVDLSGTVLAPGKWVLVKDIATLSAGDEIIIASAASNYAIGIAATNNYKGAAITKVGETANTTTDVTILTVEETGIAEAPYAFKTNSKYLYAASSSENQLKGKTTLDEHGKWAVTITEGVASIMAAKSSNRKVMQFNPNNGSPIFACYASATQQALAIYRNSENDNKPSISVTPASKDFGVLTVGETAPQEFEITALNITQALNAELTGEGFTKSDDIVDNKITITFAPTEVKEYSATLTIRAGTEAEASVTISGKGAAATYTVTYDSNGATGAAPTDATKYVAGDKVTIAGQGDMTYAGYRFTGWKYGENIYKAGAKFTMPAENVTFVAQWVEKQKFDAGYWVLVTDASELNADDYVVIAAADYDVAMKSYETGNNNCKQVEVKKVNNLLTWNENVGVFQLDKSGENYTFQDVNTVQYLYAAGGTSDNYLKAADEIPADENAKKYTWTISIADNKATIKAQIEDNGENKARNTIMYNATAGKNGQLFSCYASGQNDIALYKYVTDYTYTRDGLTNGKFGTICLPYASASTTGAYFYEVAGKEEDKVYLASVDALAAGVPYIFEATASTITVTYTGEAVGAPQNDEANGLVGTFTNETIVPEGAYILHQNAFRTSDDPANPNKVNANRAYLVMSEVPTDFTKMPGRRYIGMDVEGENEATGLDNIQLPNANSQKLIINGQLIIIRDGEMYNAQGQKL